MTNLFRLARPWLIGAAAMTLTFLPQQAYAAKTVETYVDGRQLIFSDLQPFIQDDRTLIPMRGFLEALGATVGWDAESKTAVATLGATEVRATIGSRTAFVNGAETTLDVPAQIVADRTVIPLRFFAENLGLTVGWDQELRAVSVQTQNRTAPPSRDSAVTASRRGVALTESARQFIGYGYAWGGISPDTGFDCSGFIYYLTGQMGLSAPRTSQEQYQMGIAVEQADLVAGDLVFFTTYEAGPSHVGIYDGNGSFIHAQSSETGVRSTAMDNPWWSSRYIGARRILR